MKKLKDFLPEAAVSVYLSRSDNHKDSAEKHRVGSAAHHEQMAKHHIEAVKANQAVNPTNEFQRHSINANVSRHVAEAKRHQALAQAAKEKK